jgi:CheY-like chemotaxis protein/methylmalonyl-CoA mutase cobalamin-binding subunit
MSAQAPYEIILMDCHMPNMDGYDATRIIRDREGDLVHTPIIAVTAAAMAQDQDRCIAAGMDDYLSKPIELSRLVTLIRKYRQASHKAPNSAISSQISQKEKDDYFEELLDGDLDRCTKSVALLRARGVLENDLYLNLLQPSMYRIGELWSSGHLTLAVSHESAIITNRLLANLPQASISGPGKLTAVVACAPGEEHQLGAQMIRNSLELSGYKVHYIGSGLPNDSLVQILQKTKPALLTLSATQVDHLPALIDLLRFINSIQPELEIIIGGQAIRGEVIPQLRQFSNVSTAASLEEFEDYLKWISLNYEMDPLVRCS